MGVAVFIVKQQLLPIKSDVTHKWGHVIQFLGDSYFSGFQHCWKHQDNVRTQHNIYNNKGLFDFRHYNALLLHIVVQRIIMQIHYETCEVALTESVLIQSGNVYKSNRYQAACTVMYSSWQKLISSKQLVIGFLDRTEQEVKSVLHRDYWCIHRRKVNEKRALWSHREFSDQSVAGLYEIHTSIHMCKHQDFN